ncbi:MAG: ABC transporter transmembrane domain-containing protein, partial [Promethearchaeota archaeon]
MAGKYENESILKKYLKKYWILLTFSVALATLSNYCNLLLPQFISELVDEIILKSRFDIIPQFIRNLAVIFLFGGIFDLGRTLLTQLVSNNVIYNIRNDMFQALQRQSYSFYDMNRTGNLMSKTTHDVNAVRNFLVNQFQNFFKNIITFIIIFVFVWQTNWQMAILFLGLTPPLCFLMVWYRKRIRPAAYNMYRAKGMLISTLQENIAGVRVIKAFGRQEMEMEKYIRQNEEFIEKSKKVIKLQTLYGPLSEFFTMGGSTLLVFLGGYLVVNGLMSLGNVVESFVYFSLVYDPIRAIVNFFNQLAANRAAMDRINEILENRSEIVVEDKPIDPSRVLGDLYIRLLKDEKILQEINNYMGISTSYDPISYEIRQKLKKFEEEVILPRGVKVGAANGLGFRGNKPLIFGDEDFIGPVAKKIANLVKTERFRIDLRAEKKRHKKNVEEKGLDPINFIIGFFHYLTDNEALMNNVYERLMKYDPKLELAELRRDKLNAILLYVEKFAEDEFEIERVCEIQKLLYSPSQKDHIEIAKKYDKLLVKKGILEPSRKETILANKVVTQNAISFLQIEKEIIAKELRKAQMEADKKYGNLIEQEIDEDIKPIEIKPIQINTKFDEISWAPVSVSNINGHVLFKEVYFAYPDQKGDEKKYALRNINLDVKPGETIAILGATGSGKTTLINLIPRFYDATEGNIYIDGVDIRELDLKKYRKQIGIVAQETFLFSRSIKDNISYGRKRVKMEDIIAVAKIAAIHNFIMSLPDGYDTIVGERGQTLSGGQKQRIAIARALLLDPKILILDDSLSAVDVDTEYEIQQALEYLFEGRTTFIITQRLSTIRNCNRIIVLDEGEIVEQGTHEELLELGGIYSKIYSTLFKHQEKVPLKVDPEKEIKKRELKLLRRKKYGTIWKDQSKILSIIKKPKTPESEEEKAKEKAEKAKEKAEKAKEKAKEKAEKAKEKAEKAKEKAKEKA